MDLSEITLQCIFLRNGYYTYILYPYTISMNYNRMTSSSTRRLTKERNLQASNTSQTRSRTKPNAPTPSFVPYEAAAHVQILVRFLPEIAPNQSNPPDFYYHILNLPVYTLEQPTPHFPESPRPSSVAVQDAEFQ